jgi:hypothetical protein
MHHAAGGLGLGQGDLHALIGQFVDQGPHQGPGLAGIAHGDRGVGGFQTAHQGVGHVLVDEQAAQGGAALAGGAHGGEGHPAQGEVEVGRGGDDGGVVAAQFQDGAGEARGQHRRHGAAHAGGAGGGQDRDLGIGHQGGAHIALALEHLAEIGRGVAEPGGGLQEDRLYGLGGERGLFRGLPDDGIAADQRQRGVPAPDRHREVEGRDHPADAQGVPGLHHPVAGAFGGDGQAMELARQTDGEVADVDHLLDLAQALGGDLAGLQGHQAAEVGLGRTKLLAEQADQLAAPGRRDLAPGEEGLVATVHRGVHLRRGRCAQAGDGGAVDGRARFQVGSRQPAEVDAQIGESGEGVVADRGQGAGVGVHGQALRAEVGPLIREQDNNSITGGRAVGAGIVLLSPNSLAQTT